MSKSVVLPKDVWEAIKTIRLFCGARECSQCPILSESEKCTFKDKTAENWFYTYRPVESDTITLKEEEENVK